MLTINMGESITLLPGVRFQNLRTSYTGNRGVQLPDAGSGIAFNARDTTATNSQGFLLPMGTCAIQATTVVANSFRLY